MKDFVSLENSKQYIRFLIYEENCVVGCVQPITGSLLFASYFPGLRFDPECGGSMGVWSSEVLYLYQATCYIPGDNTLHSHCCESLKLTRFLYFTIKLSSSSAFCVVVCSMCSTRTFKKIKILLKKHMQVLPALLPSQKEEMWPRL
jgi:hypothetical protein